MNEKLCVLYTGPLLFCAVLECGDICR